MNPIELNLSVCVSYSKKNYQDFSFFCIFIKKLTFFVSDVAFFLMSSGCVWRLCNIGEGLLQLVIYLVPEIMFLSTQTQPKNRFLKKLGALPNTFHNSGFGDGYSITITICQSILDSPIFGALAHQNFITENYLCFGPFVMTRVVWGPHSHLLCVYSLSKKNYTHVIEPAFLVDWLYKEYFSNS